MAGDALDIAMLGAAARSPRSNRGAVGAALAFVVGVTAVDVIAAQAVSTQHGRRRGASRDYGDRSGFPNGLEQARGAARDFRSPREYRAASDEAEFSPPTLEPGGNGAERAQHSPG